MAPTYAVSSLSSAIISPIDDMLASWGVGNRDVKARGQSKGVLVGRCSDWRNRRKRGDRFSNGDVNILRPRFILLPSTDVWGCQGTVGASWVIWIACQCQPHSSHPLTRSRAPFDEISGFTTLGLHWNLIVEKWGGMWDYMLRSLPVQGSSAYHRQRCRRHPTSYRPTIRWLSRR